MSRAKLPAIKGSKGNTRDKGVWRKPDEDKKASGSSFFFADGYAEVSFWERVHDICASSAPSHRARGILLILHLVTAVIFVLFAL
jgi:hypothetical protein